MKYILHQFFISLRILLLCVLLCCEAAHFQAQNLVPNPSFETFTTCPSGLTSDPGPMLCTPWVVPTGGTADYFNGCNGGNVGVPMNIFGNQEAHTGVAYVGGHMWNGDVSGYREYVEVQLDEPLVAGVSYNVSLYYSLADGFCRPSDRLGIYLSTVEINDPFTATNLGFQPQIEFEGGLIDNIDSWELLSGCYIAQGGEQWIIIGNFYPDSETQVGDLCGIANASYMYIDDVTVEEGGPPGELEFTLGEDVVTCGDYLIVGPIENGVYTWQDGSHEHDYQVDQTGEYIVTISQGCGVGVDTIEVTILDDIVPIDLGDPEETLCAGDEIVYDFDPALGDYLWQDNTTSPSYTISTSGVYAVTLTNDCGMSEDVITVTFVDPPALIDFGPDTTLCPAEVLEFNFDPEIGDFTWQDGSTGSSMVADAAGEYAVTISNLCGTVTDMIIVSYYPEPFVLFTEDTLRLCGDETFIVSLDPDIGEYLWNDGTIGPDYEITAPGEYIVTVTNVCGSDVSSVYADYDNEPELDLGPDITLCPGELPFTINLTGLPDAEHFMWQDGSVAPVFTITTEGTYSVTVTNDCYDVSDAIQVVVENAPPVVTLPADTMLCPGEILILNLGNVPGSATWQDGSPGSIYEITEAGVYSVTVTNACGEGLDSVAVVYQAEIPELDLGPDLDLCPGESAVIQAGVIGVDLLWQDGSTADSLLISSADTVILTISDGCAIRTDSVIVSLNGAAPMLNLPDAEGLCAGETIMLNSGVTGATYQWSSGETSSSILIDAAGLYILTVTNSCGSDIDTTLVMDLGSAPVLDLGVSVSLCPGDSLILDPGLPGQYLWSDGSTASTFIAYSAGQIGLTVTNACGSVEDSISISVMDAAPVIDLGQDTSLCPGASFLLDPGMSGVTYLWSDGSGAMTYLVDGPGEITLQITTSCGTSTDTLLVSALPGIPDLDLGPDFSICPGEAIDLMPGLSGVSYLWQDGSSGDFFTVSAAGEIILTIENSCGLSTDTLVVSEDANGPQLDLGDDISVCEGETVIITPGIPGVQYLWQDGSTGSSYTATESDIIVLQISNVCGTTTDTLVVTISGTVPDVDLGADGVLCDGASVTLVVDPLEGEIVWQDGSMSETYDVVAAGTYTVMVANTCGIAYDTIVFGADTSPQEVDLGPDVQVCPGDSIVLRVDDVDPDHSLLWNTGSANPVIRVDAGLYIVEISSGCGSVTDSILITEDGGSLHIPSDNYFPICSGETVELDIRQDVDAQYLWSDGTTTPVLEVGMSGTYLVTVTSNCEEAEAAFVVLDGDCAQAEIYIPNVFSPNGDGFNDLFSVAIDPQDIMAFEMQIYDRWGEQVYVAENAAFAWDGVFHGRPLQPGVYVYYLKYQREGRNAEFISGDITLVR